VTGRTLDDPLFFDEVLENLKSLFIDGIRPRA
jgi:TetR/AcrR family transcriptional regulator